MGFISASILTIWVFLFGSYKSWSSLVVLFIGMFYIVFQIPLSHFGYDRVKMIIEHNRELKENTKK